MENRFDIDGLFSHYQNQVFKMLGLFEGRDVNGYKVGIRVKSELEQLPQQFKELYDDYRFNIIIAKIDALIDELLLLDGEHQFVKNHVMECCNLLDDVKVGLK